MLLWVVQHFSTPYDFISTARYTTYYSFFFSYLLRYVSMTGLEQKFMSGNSNGVRYTGRIQKNVWWLWIDWYFCWNLRLHTRKCSKIQVKYLENRIFFLNHNNSTVFRLFYDRFEEIFDISEFVSGHSGPDHIAYIRKRRRIIKTRLSRSSTKRGATVTKPNQGQGKCTLSTAIK